MNPNCDYAEMSVGILNSIYTIYKDRDDSFIDGRIDDYRHFSLLESLWSIYPEPELNLKSILIK